MQGIVLGTNDNKKICIRQSTPKCFEIGGKKKRKTKIQIATISCRVREVVKEKCKEIAKRISDQSVLPCFQTSSNVGQIIKR